MSGGSSDEGDKLNCVSNEGNAIVFNDPLPRIKLNCTETTAELNDNGANNDAEVEVFLEEPVVPFVVWMGVDANNDADNSITDTKLPTYEAADVVSPFHDEAGNDEAGGTKLRVVLVEAKATAMRGCALPPLPLLLLVVLPLADDDAVGNDATAKETLTLGVTTE